MHRSMIRERGNIRMPASGNSGPSVLFVCTENRCRSVAAAALWAERLPRIAEDWADWRVSSAGTWADEGEPPLRGMISLLRSRGIDVDDVRSRRLTGAMLAAHRLALVMEPNHKEALHVEFSELKGRVYLLSEPAGRETPVADPDTDLPEAFAACLETIETLLDRGEKRIVALARRSEAPGEGRRRT